MDICGSYITFFVKRLKMKASLAFSYEMKENGRLLPPHSTNRKKVKATKHNLDR